MSAASATRVMRLHSTKESTAAGEPSVLAIVETLLASAVLIWLSIHFNTTRWLAVAVCLAPLTLLRTEESVLRGLRWKEWWDVGNRFTWGVGALSFLLWNGSIVFIWREHGWGWGLGMIPLGLLPAAVGVVALFFFSIRFGATLGSVLRHPVATAAAMPRNWQRIVLATDSANDPEFIPGDDHGPVSGWKESWISGDGFDRWFFTLLALFVYPFFASYRWSVKATCLVYTPLLWLAGKARYSPPDLRLALEDYQVDPLTRLRAVFTLFLLAFFAAKVAFMAAVNGFAAWCESTPGLTWLSLLIAPRSIPLWQLAAAGNSLLFLGLWRYAWKQARLYNTGRPPDPARVLTIWRTFTVLSVLLTIYTIGCQVTLLVREGDPLDTLRDLWQSIGHKLWP